MEMSNCFSSIKRTIQKDSPQDFAVVPIVVSLFLSLKDFSLCSFIKTLLQKIKALILTIQLKQF